jgi:hypothetical protein
MVGRGFGREFSRQKNYGRNDRYRVLVFGIFSETSEQLIRSNCQPDDDSNKPHKTCINGLSGNIQ